MIVGEIPCEAPWLSGLGACLIMITDIRRNKDGTVEFQVGDENCIPYDNGNDWVKADDFFEEPKPTFAPCDIQARLSMIVLLIKQSFSISVSVRMIELLIIESCLTHTPGDRTLFLTSTPGSMMQPSQISEFFIFAFE